MSTGESGLALIVWTLTVWVSTRHVVEEPVHQPLCPTHRRGLDAGGLGRERVDVDAVGPELLGPEPDPVREQRTVDLGMELQSQASPLAEGLRAVGVAGDLGGAVGNREAVVVPLEPRPRREAVGLVAVDA